jgi:predicted O-linked N-acetylglucosamine transferase (SPINDLY family)
VWGRVLERVPGSRLLLKGKGFIEEAARQSLLARFTQLGGDARRVILLAPVDGVADHLAVYGQVDIALDPFPYNGTTTTCEALWMGVPTVTLAGDRHAGRVGASLLTQMSLTDLIASSPDAYVDIAASLAADRDRLSSLRQTLRERMRASSLCDAQRFARKIEATYRAVWQKHCVKAAAAQSGGSGHMLEVRAARQ